MTPTNARRGGPTAIRATRSGQRGRETRRPLQTGRCVTPETSGGVSLMDPREINHLSVEEKKARFRQATVTHRLLGQTHRKILRAVREPAGFTFVLTYGPTGVGKSKMIETVVRQINEVVQTPSSPALHRPLPPASTPVLV